MRFKFKRQNHINVLESAVVGTLMRYLCRVAPRARVNVWMDSRVSVGAGTKGRSPSRPMCLEWRRISAWIVGGCLYPGFHWTWSETNRGDGPSRDADPAPPGRDIPEYLRRARAGDYTGWDWVRSIGGLRKVPAKWMRFTTNLWLRSGLSIPPR